MQSQFSESQNCPEIFGKIYGIGFSEQASFHPEKLLSHKLPAVKGVCLHVLDLESFMAQGFVGVKRALNLESRGFHSSLNFSTPSVTVSKPHNHSELSFPFT